jgi:hypothetical protein
VLATPTLSSATIVTYTYTGTVSSGYDQTGDFGAPNTNLAGDSFTAVFTYDTTKGNPFNSVTFDTSYLYRSGGTGFWSHLGSNPLTAVLSINGSPFSNFIGLGNDLGQNYLMQQTAPLTPYIFTQQFVQTYDGTAAKYAENDVSNTASRYVYMNLSSAGTGISPVLDTPNSLVINGGSPVSGDGYFADYNYECVGGCNNNYDNYANLDPTSLTISGVPEPSAWAMMILGFLGLGFLAYRKKRNLRFA